MRQFFKIVGKIIKVKIIICLFIGMTCIGYALAVIENIPKTNLNEFKYLSETSFIYDSDGNLTDEVPTLEKRVKVTSDLIPEILKNAYIATEDKRFYTHKGVDFIRILGAVKSSAIAIVKNEGNIEGGSTITQQLIKNVILTPDRTIKRKLQEIVLAIVVDDKLSKDEILTLYLNTIHLGGYAYGVELASNQYFNKSVNELNLLESAFLAGITQSPSYYYPFSERNIDNPSIYLNRTETVLELMYTQAYITETEYNEAVEQLKNDGLHFTTPTEITSTLNYEWFNREVIETVKNDLMKKYNYTYYQASNYIENSGLKIYTTMDKDLQDYSENVIYNADSYIDIMPLEDLNGLKQPQIAATIIDYTTGEVKVAVGGRYPQDALTINRAISSNFLKPTGSTAKPFTVYTPLIESGAYTPSSIVKDAPLNESFLKKYNYKFQPQNDQLTYYGDITLQSALARSLNTVALTMVDKIGLNTSKLYGESFGLKYNSNSSNSIASVALGQFNNDPSDLDGANPLMVAEAFGVFGNKGVRTKSILYSKVLDKNGNIILENKLSSKKIITSNTAYTMFKMMEDSIKVNTSNVVLFDNMPISGKSGTSENSENLWFGGLTPYYSAAVWVGSDNPHTITSKNGIAMYGNNTSGVIWREIMKYAHRNLPYKDLEKPTVIETPINTVKLDVDTEYKDETTKEEYNKAKREEEAKKIEEQIKKKQEEERLKQEEERKKQEEERKKQEEEERKKQEENKRQEEEERLKQEEEKRREEESNKENENLTPDTQGSDNTPNDGITIN